MRTKDPELMKQILEYIEDYYIVYNASPSTTLIAERVRIGRGTVQISCRDGRARDAFLSGQEDHDGTDGEDAHLYFQGGSRGRYIMRPS